MPYDDSLRMTAYPPDGPWERWELTVESTGQVLASGAWPYDEDQIRQVCRDYFARRQEAPREGFV